MENKDDSINDNNNEYKSLIEEEEEENGLEAEEFCDEFQCCICLDLLYKPVVLACGHMSCFWCVFSAMNSWHESYCPVCRQPYNHFPSVCQLLHFLLLKLYPLAYKSRERQVREEEKKVGHFSPQFDYQLFGSHPSEELNILDNHQHSLTHPQTNLCQKIHSGEGESSSIRNSLEVTVCHRDNASIEPETASKRSEATANATMQEFNLLGNDLEQRAHKQVTVDDLPCGACKKLLFRPVVLNCGHVYCESCIIVPGNGVPRCQVCQSLHPNGFPSVCLILDHLLEERFPGIYAERRDALLKQTDFSTLAQQHAARSSSISSDVYTSWLFGNGPKVHFQFGCDSCGMSPIIGERYNCKDCKEKIGFDLCEGCYKTPTRIPGRFNQQHKPEHNFEIVQPEKISDLIHRLNAEQSDDDGSDSLDYLDDVSRAHTLSGDVPQDPEVGSREAQDVSLSFILSVDLSLDTEDDSDDPVSSNLT